MEAPASYLPTAKDAEPGNRSTTPADEEIVLFANKPQNNAVSPATAGSADRSWKISNQQWQITDQSAPMQSKAPLSPPSSSSPDPTAADVSASSDSPSTAETAIDKSTESGVDTEAVADAFKNLTVSSKTAAEKQDPAEVAFPNVHSTPADYRAPPPPRQFQYDQRVPHHAYGDHQYPDRQYQPQAGAGVVDQQNSADWPHQQPKPSLDRRKVSDDGAVHAPQYGRGANVPSNGYHRGGYDGAAAGAGAVGVMPHQYNGGAPGYITPGPTYGQPPHVVPLHNAYAHHQQPGMYEMPFSPTEGPGGIRGPLAGYPRPAPVHHGSSDPRGELGLVGQQQQQQPGAGPFSPLSPAPIHNPYAHHHHPPHHHIQSYPPPHNGAAGVHAQQSRVGGGMPGYPGAPIHQTLPSGYAPQFYDEVYAQETQNAMYARYNNSPHIVNNGGVNGAVNPASPYGNPPVSPYPPQALVGQQQGPGAQPGTPGSVVVGVDGQNGPSANNRKLGLYKTELCRSWEEKGSCRYGPKCQFAHGEEEIRKVARHPKYKTEICRTFWVSGSCPYGKRCCFIHTELPAPGAPGNPNPPPPGTAEARTPGSGPVTSATPAVGTPEASNGHTRSTSTGSDPSDQPSSLLARISAKRGNAEANGTTTDGAPNGAPTYPFPPASATSPTNAAPNSATAGQTNRIPSAPSARPDFSHNRHLSTLSDGRPEGAESPSFNGGRPGHSHSASAHTLVTPPSFGASFGGQPAGRQQFTNSGGDSGVNSGAATPTGNGGLGAPAFWHKRSASGGSVNASWTNPAGGEASAEQTQPLRSIYSSLTPTAS